ncbi:hypothetical protein COLO4_10658 [Corchorus olitorius]|uniref:Uncharacterized protein n=1 Tax=Corchorus olitorius TaxID=93759 RepID=A0A1R3K7E9_9ROSI|nr:hypothetical protein COLO4_10658 [Corchorus olitorius]
MSLAYKKMLKTQKLKLGYCYSGDISRPDPGEVVAGELLRKKPKSH